MSAGGTEVSILIAFTAGFLSFVSPCVLPLIPGYLSFITGFSLEDVTDPNADASVERRVMVQSLLFIAGFSTIFIVFGLSITALGQLANNYQDLIRQVGGVIVIILGLHVAGLLPTRFLYKEKKLSLKNKPAGIIGSFLVGVTFGAAWTPLDSLRRTHSGFGFNFCQHQKQLISGLLPSPGLYIGIGYTFFPERPGD
ncbi:MAG: cytochrome c biogenesis protein CcdA [Deltaproteobacteria bacterium]|nr:cytochrome c biogenesis protein CcdA [Deltaproteobacteria bacterium]